jgi:hypothetical protein
MRKRKGLFVLPALFVLTLLLTTPGVGQERLDPAQALGSWTDESYYVAARLGDIKPLIQDLLSAKPFRKALEEEPDAAAVLQWLASLPVESGAFAGGLRKGVLQVQGALSLTAEGEELLKRLAEGALISKDLELAENFGLRIAGPAPTPLGVPCYRISPIDEEHPLLGLSMAAKENLLLVGMTPRDIDGSIAALADPSRRFAPTRKFADRNYLILHDNGLLQMGLLAAPTPIFLNSHVEMELAFDKSDEALSLGFYTNLPKAMLSEEHLRGFAPLDKPVPLLGGGKTLLALSAPVNYDAFAKFIRTYGDDEAKSSLEQALEMLGQLGITEADLRDLARTFSIVIGGGASFMSAPLPGAYALVEGTGEAAKKIATIVAELLRRQQLPLEELKVEGWDTVYSMSIPATVTIAVKGSTLLVGFLDAQKLAAPQESDPTLAELLAKKSLQGFLFLDAKVLAREMLQFLQAGDIWDQLIGSDEAGEMGEGMIAAMTTLQSLDTLRAEASDMESLRLSLTLRPVTSEDQTLLETVVAKWRETHPLPEENEEEISEEEQAEATPTP